MSLLRRDACGAAAHRIPESGPAAVSGYIPTDPDFEIYKQIMNASEEELEVIIDEYVERKEQRERERKVLDTE